MSLRRAARGPSSHGKIVLTIGHSLCEVLSRDEGRARSWELNALCRAAFAVTTAGNIRWARSDIESKRNPPGADSRLAERGVLQPGETTARAGGRQAGADHAARRAARRVATTPVEWRGWPEKYVAVSLAPLDAASAASAHPAPWGRGPNSDRPPRRYFAEVAEDNFGLTETRKAMDGLTLPPCAGAPEVRAREVDSL